MSTRRQSLGRVADTVAILHPFSTFDDNKQYYDDKQSTTYYANVWTAVIKNFEEHNILPAGKVTADDVVWGGPIWHELVDYRTKTDEILKKHIELNNKGADNAGNHASAKCKYPVRAHALSPTPSMTWAFALISGGSATTVTSMKIVSVPTPAALKVACSGHGCPSKSQSAGAVKPAKCKGKKCHARSRDVDLTRLFRGHALSVGSRITVTVTQRNTSGKAFVFAIRQGKLPKAQVGCLAPGSSKLNRGC